MKEGITYKWFLKKSNNINHIWSGKNVMPDPPVRIEVKQNTDEFGLNWLASFLWNASPI